MRRSLSCLSIAALFVLALVLSTVPAQAQPRDFDTGLPSLDVPWIDAALGWLEGLLGLGGPESPKSMSTVIIISPPSYGALSGSCIDPSGYCGFGGGGGGSV